MEDAKLAETLTFRLAVVGTTLQNEFARHLKGADLNPKQLGVLNVVDEAMARTQDDVAKLMRVTPGMVVRLVDHLEERGFLTRQRDPDNRRKHILTVTSQGREILHEAAAFAAGLDEAVLSDTGRALGNHLDKALDKLMQTLIEG